MPSKAIFNSPLCAGKGTIYEGGIRVCAFANWPGHIPAGQTIDEPLSAADWYPTLAKPTGATLPQKLPLDGLDIWPVLTTRQATGTSCQIRRDDENRSPLWRAHRGDEGLTEKEVRDRLV